MTLQGRIVERVLTLPPAVTRTVKVTRDLRIPTPDGVELLADLYTPSRVPGAPTVLIRTPYGRRGMVSRLTSVGFAERGYQVLVATCRGTDGSGGVFDPFRHDEKDGISTLDWLENQPWHNGHVLTFGPSYLGYVQMALGPSAGDRITAMMPVISTSGVRDLWYGGGSFELAALLAWTARMVTLERVRNPLKADVLELKGDKRARRATSHLPLSDADDLGTGKRVDWWQSWLRTGSEGDPYWGPEREHRARAGEITAPTHLFGGWHDVLLPGQLADYAAMRAAGRSPFLTIGPWLHVSTELFGAAMREALEWFPAYLTGKNPRTRPVRLFVQGAEEWRDYTEWPPAGGTERNWHLRPGGGLTREPTADAGPDRFRYDPADPTPTVGGPLLDPRTGGSKDNTALEARPDVLTYTGNPLAGPVEAIGPVSATIKVRTSGPHADLFVRLCDVDRDGRSVNVCEGIQRLCPDKHPADVGGVRTVEVALWPTAYRFKPGHRLRVQVSGGSFPRYARNTGTGQPLATAVELRAVDYEILPGSTITMHTMGVE
ncbi:MULTISPECIES: CocE/NonD family hydrolase [unclassified Crossiella]|uniref:CocE/NonD family hydrolase n=1 Tax=unclassified Crossiella TaxID=2620835 RepID=UPI001FFFE88D|nr:MULTISPECIES: CocE/NonD family hydrolase [unclassified Crossiella]MCK2243748.1 CocE/NonD family hydrolase [Crossiella sp. S99.2]MCK2257607.1 CocE/NonD family hydrolase [Crossiella sp. S99.1]